MIDINQPVANPKLLEAIAVMKADGSSGNLNRVINEVMRAKFLSPVTIASALEPDEDYDAAVRKENSAISFHLIEDDMNHSYFPAFTDRG